LNKFYSRRFYLAGLLLLVVSGLTLIMVPGCSKNSVSVPLSNDELAQEKLAYLNNFFAPGGPQLGTPLDSCPVLIDTVLESLVDENGANLGLVTENDNIAFKIPSMALLRPALISIHLTKYKASFGPFWLLDCGPDGTVFNKPLEVDLNGSTYGVNILFYFNEKTQQWEVEEIAPSNDNLLIDHFSKYAISD